MKHAISIRRVTYVRNSVLCLSMYKQISFYGTDGLLYHSLKRIES